MENRIAKWLHDIKHAIEEIEGFMPDIGKGIYLMKNAPTSEKSHVGNPAALRRPANHYFVWKKTGLFWAQTRPKKNNSLFK